MKAKYIPLSLLQKAVANVVGIIVVGGAVVFVVWIGAKVISRVISIFDKEEKEEFELAAVGFTPTAATVTSPTPTVLGGVAGGQQFGPEREHNQDHRLSISLWSPGVIGVYVPTYTAIDWSLDGNTWIPWATNRGPDEIELFDTTLHPQMFFRSRGIQDWIYK